MIELISSFARVVAKFDGHTNYSQGIEELVDLAVKFSGATPKARLVYSRNRIISGMAFCATFIV